MGNKVRFTEGRVQAFTCARGKKYGIHLDTETDGLGVRVTENGARSYVFEKRVNKRSMRLTIGECRPLATEESPTAGARAYRDGGARR